jgi:hypothetical protein
MHHTAPRKRNTRLAPLHAVLALALLTASGAAPQDATSPADDLDELIDRVAEMESFRATYRVHSSDGRIGLMHWIYVADDTAHVHMEVAEESRDLFWIKDGVMTAGALDSNGDEYIVGTDVGAQLEHYEPVYDALDQKFPLAGSPAFEASLQFSLVLDADTDKVDLSVGIIDRKTSLFVWLPTLKRVEQVEQDDAELFVFSRDGLTYELSAINGFITRGWIGTDEDRRLAVELIQLELDPEISDDEIEVPEWTGTDAEIDAGFQSAIRNTLLLNSRSTVLRRLQALHDRDELEWPDGGPQGLLALLTELHTVGKRYDMQAYLAKVTGHLEARAENLLVWADEHRETEGMPAQLAELSTQAREELEQILEQIIDTQVERLQGPTDGELELEADFVELERIALRAALESELRESALQHFDETVGAVE